MSVTSELPISSIGDLSSELPAPGAVDVTIEVLGEDIGDQVQVERLPWHALIYDETERVLELSVGERGPSVEVVFRHQIHNPTKVWVEREGGMVIAISIEQRSGPRTIVRFHEHKALAPGS